MQPTGRSKSVKVSGTMGSKGRASSEKSGGSRTIKILKASKWYVTLSAFAGGIVSLVSAIYAVMQFIEIKPLQAQNADLKQTITALETSNQSVKSQLDRLRQQYAELIGTTDQPVLIFPSDRSSVIGMEQPFLWDYKRHESTSGYIMEIRDLSSSAQPAVKVNVVRPETKRMHYSFEKENAISGEYLWRIRPGQFAGGKEIGQGPWSHTNIFSVYKTVTDRIRMTGKLIVATTPTSYDAFVSSDGSDQYAGFEVELVDWLAAQLGQSMRLPQALMVEVKEVPWTKMFNIMQNGEADIAIRSITRSISREKEYPNLRFSKGYQQNHQILVQIRKEGTFPDSLNGAIVGVKENTINEKAARYLSLKYKFKVDASYVAYGDLYQALREGRINFALVDSTLATKFLNKQVSQFGQSLDTVLKPFYLRELGQENEEYAVLIHESNPKDDLRKVLDGILNSEAYKAFSATLRGKYHLS